MSRSTRRCAYAALRGAPADAVDNELLATDPVEKVKRPRASTPGATSLTPEQAASLLRAAAGLRYATVLGLMLGEELQGSHDQWNIDCATHARCDNVQRAIGGHDRNRFN